ncbi:hypothetical protein, partial [Streptomyces sp. NPDC002491]
PGETSAPVPRDPPDQQADAGAEDPWDVAGPDRPESPASAEDVPDADADESGTGRKSASHPDIDQSDEPLPEEPSA